MVTFVDGHRDDYGVQDLDDSPVTYYKVRQADPSRRVRIMMTRIQHRLCKSAVKRLGRASTGTALSIKAERGRMTRSAERTLSCTHWVSSRVATRAYRR